MKCIIAINKAGYIGLNGSLPWKCKDDLKHFKALTDGCKLLVGYNTSINLPPLKNRELIIDERNGVIDNINDIDWCIGGKKTYEKYAHLFSELHVSIINDETIGDVKAPDFYNLNQNCKIFTYNYEPNEDVIKVTGEIKIKECIDKDQIDKIINNYESGQLFGELSHPDNVNLL